MYLLLTSDSLSPFSLRNNGVWRKWGVVLYKHITYMIIWISRSSNKEFKDLFTKQLTCFFIFWKSLYSECKARNQVTYRRIHLIKSTNIYTLYEINSQVIRDDALFSKTLLDFWQLHVYDLITLKNIFQEDAYQRMSSWS